MKRAILGLLLALLCVGDVSAQGLLGRIFHRDRGNGGYCPPGEYCPPTSRGLPPPAQDDVPAWAVKATCEVWQGNHGGSGGLFGIAEETGKAYVLTCRHVISSDGGITIKLSNGQKRAAKFLGYSSENDVSLLEIDASDVPGLVPLADAEPEIGTEICQVGYGVNATRQGQVNKRLGKITARKGNEYQLNFRPVSGDSGSPVYDVAGSKLLGILWGHYDDGRATITGPRKCRDFVLTCLRKRNRPAPSPGAVKPEPTTPATPVKPATDLGPIMDALGKLTDISKATAEKIGDLDKRVGLLENTPPPAPNINQSQIVQIQADLDKIRQSLKQQGTVRIRVNPAAGQ